jgi:hypothetical protein
MILLKMFYSISHNIDKIIYFEKRNILLLVFWWTKMSLDWMLGFYIIYQYNIRNQSKINDIKLL